MSATAEDYQRQTAALAQLREQLDRAPDILERLGILVGPLPSLPLAKLDVGRSLIRLRSDLSTLQLAAARMEIEIALIVADILATCHTEEPPMA